MCGPLNHEFSCICIIHPTTNYHLHTLQRGSTTGPLQTIEARGERLQRVLVLHEVLHSRKPLPSRMFNIYQLSFSSNFYAHKYLSTEPIRRYVTGSRHIHLKMLFHPPQPVLLRFVNTYMPAICPTRDPRGYFSWQSAVKEDFAHCLCSPFILLWRHLACRAHIVIQIN